VVRVIKCENGGAGLRVGRLKISASLQCPSQAGHVKHSVNRVEIKKIEKVF